MYIVFIYTNYASLVLFFSSSSWRNLGVDRWFSLGLQVREDIRQSCFFIGRTTKGGRGGSNLWSTRKKEKNHRRIKTDGKNMNHKVWRPTFFLSVFPKQFWFPGTHTRYSFRKQLTNSFIRVMSRQIVFGSCPNFFSLNLSLKWECSESALKSKLPENRSHNMKLQEGRGGGTSQEEYSWIYVHMKKYRYGLTRMSIVRSLAFLYLIYFFCSNFINDDETASLGKCLMQGCTLLKIENLGSILTVPVINMINWGWRKKHLDNYEIIPVLNGDFSFCLF